MNRVWTNTLWKILAILGGKLLVFVLLFAAARRLSLADFGYFSFALAFGYILFPLIDAGLGTALWREATTAADAGRRAYSSSRRLLGATALGGLAIGLTVLCFFALPPAAFWLTVLILAGIAISVVVNLRQAVFKSRERLREDALVSLAANLAYVILGLLGLWAGAGLVGLGLAFLAGQGCGAYVAFRLALFTEPERVDPHPTPGELWRSSWPFALIGLFTVVYFRVDALLLERLAGAAEVGLYSAAYRLIEAAMILPAAFLAAYFPRLAREAETKPVSGDLTPHFQWLIGTAALGVVFGSFFAGDVLELLFGAAYRQGSSTLILLLPALLSIYPNYLLTTLLVAHRRQKSFMKITALCALANILLNCLAIPLWERLGAAGSTLVTEGLLTFLAVRELRPHLPRISLQKLLVPLNYAAIFGLLLGLLYFVSPSAAMVGGCGLLILGLIAAWWRFHRQVEE
ncbi:MAG: flippase [Myxococcales bacterium]|nr:flippase [Myxococcales bacterium]